MEISLHSRSQYCYGLTQSDHKIEADLITSSIKNLKYLEVMIKNLSFKIHLDFVAGKAVQTIVAICKIFSNTRGPTNTSRKVLIAVIMNTVLYSVPI